DAGGFHEHSEEAERRVDPDRVLGLDPPPLREVAVALLDPALGVAAVGAHVELARVAVGARCGVGTADDADHEVAGGPPRGWPGSGPPARRPGPEPQPVAARGRPAIRSLDDLLVRPADTDRHRFDEDAARMLGGLGDLVEASAAGAAGYDRQRLHD